MTGLGNSVNVLAMDDMSEWPVIHRYTRAQAIEDGVLVDVTERAKEAGFKVHTVVTRGVWEAAVTVPNGCEGFQDETGRLWDVLFVGICAMKRAPRESDRAAYTVSVIRNRACQRRNVRLVAHVGPGDNAEPVVTIMLPGED